MRKLFIILILASVFASCKKYTCYCGSTPNNKVDVGLPPGIDPYDIDEVRAYCNPQYNCLFGEVE